jgi:hypothetical protein
MRVRSTGALPRPPPSVLGVSRALDGLHPALPFRACFIPVTLLGFHLQGFDPPGKPHPSRGLACSPAVHLAPPGSTPSAARLDSRALLLPRRPCRPGPKSRTVVPSWCSPFKALPAQAVEPSLRTTLARRPPSRSLLPCTSRLAAWVLRSVAHSHVSISSLRRRWPFWAFPPHPVRALSNSSRFR